MTSILQKQGGKVIFGTPENCFVMTTVQIPPGLSCLVQKMFSKKKRKPDVVRKDVQWSTKKPHMLKKKMEHKVKQTKQACPGLRID